MFQRKQLLSLYEDKAKGLVKKLLALAEDSERCVINMVIPSCLELSVNLHPCHLCCDLVVFTDIVFSNKGGDACWVYLF